MAGYIGSKASVVSSGAERKKTFAITTSTTSLTGLVYTPNQVHVFHNGIRLVDGTDYTATDGTTITLTNAAADGDEVVVVSYATFSPADAYTKSEVYTKAEGDARYVELAGDTLTGALTGTDLTLSGGLTLSTAPSTLEHYAASFTQTSNNYSTIHTFGTPAAGHWLFTISASLGSAVYGKLQLHDGTSSLLDANWGYNLPHYSLFRIGLITLDGSTTVNFRGARNDAGSSVTMRGVQAYGVKLG